MKPSRRAFGALAAGLLAELLNPRAASAAEPPPQDAAPAHDLSAVPANWHGREQIAFLVYPQFTALDMVGPHYMLTNLLGATSHVVWKNRDPVRSDTGLVFVPSATFDECPRDLDVICVPGGTTGTLAAMQDPVVMDFLKDRGERARYVTSVCTGSLLLGAAGLLEGYRATSHWVTRDLLRIFGATPVNERVVQDRNRITGAGVTAGIDFGLTLVGSLRDKLYAESVQLLAEYAPDPPYHAGTPEQAPPEATAIMDAMFAQFVANAEAVGRTAYAASARR
jgi:putative intracellular protease/amidase